MSGSEERTLMDLNLQRDSWCQVEANPRQSWERPERRHYRGHLKTSPVLLSALTQGPKPQPVCRARLAPVQLVERRHFEESYKSQL
ncbi:spermatogenesis-associated protein 45-like [Cheilinus undulatus]|uniref:spermatogenesis-associated protein 45-like n=1 Tax=Cheilinus undulatus TaxID=241271 RepID=UPI001BD3B9A3|nr:spermatogenesis-associated protein 45-like [Cheilinus undulatus]